MKSTGIVRKIDELGRIVIPKELRKTMGISKKTPMEIYVDKDKIIFKKYQPGCTFCGSIDHIVEYKGREICDECLEKMLEKRDSA
ncbi:MAG: AbrB/MazE/SpoVT family DNA-binding domain-containing protein [Halanaerobiaceae bacterium]